MHNFNKEIRNKNIYYNIVAIGWVMMSLLIAFTWISDGDIVSFINVFILPSFYFAVPAMSIFLDAERRMLAVITISMSFILPASCVFVCIVFSGGFPSTGVEWFHSFKASVNAGMIGILLAYVIPAFQMHSRKVKFN